MVDVRQQVDSILNYWAEVVFDPARNRFFGRVDEHGQPDHEAALGSVMYSRILWSFSAAYRLTRNSRDLQLAGRAFHYLNTVFDDPVYGGVFWTVDAAENPLGTKKQIYALAFAIYGASEYYRITGDKDALNFALRQYDLIEKHSYDAGLGGYIEAFSRDWLPAADLRLSARDHNEKKTLNTHLHIMEAYVNLYQVWPDDALGRKISDIIQLFRKHFVDRRTGHLILFFNENWDHRDDIVSYGHEIETSWLLCEAAEVLKDSQLSELVESTALKLVTAAIEGMDDDGSLTYEFDRRTGLLNAEKHWWVQAEAAVGFLNAWQLTGDQQYYELFTRTWQFIDRRIIDHQHGEWFWGRNADDSVMAGEDKAGLWKCPYHNTRCLLQIAARLPQPAQGDSGGPLTAGAEGIADASANV
jgi:cellobiose epimerase